MKNANGQGVLTPNSIILVSKGLTFTDYQKQEKQNKEINQRASNLDISINQLDKLIISKEFYPLLLDLNASRNLLKEVQLNLPTLITLDLSNNKLSSFPSLKQLVQLKNLYINDNELTTIEVSHIKDIKSLMVFNISRNKINFSKVTMFLDLIAYIAEKLTCLEQLSIFDNPFTYGDIYKNYFFDYIANLSCLKELNNRKINKRDPKVSQMLRERMISEAEGGGVKIGGSKLENIGKDIEFALLNDNSFFQYFDNVKKDITEYLLTVSITPGEEFNKLDKDSEDFEEIVGCFIQAAKRFPVEEALVNVFVEFSYVCNGKYASRSFTLLRQLSESKDSLRTSLEENIIFRYRYLFNQNKVSKDKKHELSAMPLVLKGLRHFITYKYPRIINLVFPAVLKIVDLTFVKQFLTNESSSFKNCEPGNKERYELKIKYYCFSLTLKVLKCLKMKTFCQLQKDKLTEIGVEPIFKLFVQFLNVYDQIYKSKNVVFIKYHKRFHCLLSAIKIITSPNNSNLEAVHNVVFKINQQDKFGIVEFIMKIIDQFMIKRYESKFLLIRDKVEPFSFEDTTINYLFKIIIHLYALNPSYYKEKMNKLKSHIHTILSFKKNIIEGVDFAYDPILLEAANYVLLFILTHRSSFWNSNDITPYIQYFNSNVEYLLESIKFLDEGNTDNKYQAVCKISYILEHFEPTMNSIESIPNLTSPYIIKLFNSILKNLIFLNGKNERNPLVRKEFQELNKKLDSCNRDTYLIRCLEITTYKSKELVMKCFLNINFDEIASSELQRFLEILSKCNWLESSMELLISEIFIFVLRLFFYTITHKEDFKLISDNYDSVMTLCLRVLEKNTEPRTILTESEQKEYDYLNMASIMLLTNLTVFQEFSSGAVINSDYYSKQLRKIMKNEDISRCCVYKNYPIDIEKSYIGWDIENLTNLFSVLHPFNYISLRILIHMANLLCDIPFKTYDVYDTDEVVDDIIEEGLDSLKKSEVERIKLEGDSWKAFKGYKKQLIQEFKTSPSHLWIKVGDIQNEHNKFLMKFIVILKWLTGDTNLSGKNELADILEKDKYDKQLLEHKKCEFKVQHSNHLLNNINSSISQDEINLRDIKAFTKFALRSSSNKQNTKTGLNYDHIQNDITIQDPYGTSVNRLHRVDKEDSVHNLTLRCLIVSAFLRCISSSLKYKHIEAGSMITILRNEEIFAKLIYLVDSTRLNSHYIETKILLIIKKIFKNIYKSRINIDEVERMFYLSSVIISKILLNIKTKEKTEDYTEIVHAIVDCCLCMIEELSYMNCKFERKAFLMNSLLAEELMLILTDSVVKLMQQETKNQEENKLKDRVKYHQLYIYTLHLLSEFMVIKDSNSYTILEKLFYKQLVDKQSVRKTFINDLIETQRTIAIIRAINSGGFNINKVIILSRCLLTTASICKEVFMLMTEGSLIFINFNPDFLEKSFKDNIGDKLDLNNPIYSCLIADILSIYTGDFKNRIFIETTGGDFTILMRKVRSTFLFIKAIKRMDKVNLLQNCAKIFYCENARSSLMSFFLSFDDKFAKKKSQQTFMTSGGRGSDCIGNNGPTDLVNTFTKKHSSISKQDRQSFFNEKTYTDIFSERGEAEAKNYKFKVREYVFMVTYETTSILDYFFPKTKNILENNKIAFFTNDNRLIIYKENIDKIKGMSICDEILKDATELAKIYEKLEEFNLNNLTKLLVKDTEISFSISGKRVSFEVIDDWSFYTIKEILIKACHKVNLKKNLETENSQFA
jgi:hypothetical protein